ncbi:MFS transporter [Paenibacillus allorhizosphaerae]|uniref:Multidrug resistance protein MdtD n=1 Tax=Paenibacillus allorhizosphaerae TaxID=2849866 RepID=A0ABM8VKG1_9BACL|nr:MFS transporter [Paenibacillus allorhizosphaerae]CAG7646870.1 Putative multidrug resistance protein MdtD [Paenibacillus allorhizosphaerae]
MQSQAAGKNNEDAAPSNRLVQALCFVLFFSVMNATMFNVALPDIAAEFRLAPSAVSWTVTGYSVLYALGSLLFGKLADKYPLKQLITIGLLLFSGASAVGFFADSYALVLVCRLVQAAGASCVPALVMLIPVRFFPPEQRGRVMGVIASTIAFSSGLGPIVGGFIAGHFHWNGLFLISLLAPVALPFIRKSLPHEEVRTGEKVDLIGAGMLGASVASFMLSVTQFSLAWLAASAVLAACFFLRVRKAPHPFIRLSLFRIPGFVHGLIISFIALFSVFGIFLTTPMMLKAMHNLDAQAIGFVLFPAAMLAAVMGRLGGKLTDSRGSRFVLLLAFSLFIAGLVCLSSFTGLSPWIIAFCLPLINVSFTFAQAALAKIVSSTLPREQTGIGMGVYNLVNFLSGAISGAVLSKTVEFDWAALNVNAVGASSTYGTVYLILAGILVANIILVSMKLEKPIDAVRTIQRSSANG